MSKSTDPDHFFQTSHSLAETSRKALKSKNNHGTPIRLSSKILAVLADPSNDNAVYVAESAGTVRRVVLEVGSTTHLYRGPTAPLTSLALSPSTSPNGSTTTLFAGSWDKSIWSWSLATRAPKRRYHGHTDFVKALLCLRLNSLDVLISSSADTRIIIWKVSTGEKLWTLKGHTMGVLDLAVDPLTYPASVSATEDAPEEEMVVLFSAGSDRSIRRWAINTDLTSAKEIDNENPILAHETSVYSLCFDSDLDLWTASADGFVKCLSRARGWSVDTTLEHGDYVRAVAIDEVGGWVVSAGRNEDVKVWDKSSGELRFVLEGHFEEVTGLVVVEVGRGRGREKERWVVSVGIDATIRRWRLETGELGKAVREVKDERNGVEKEVVVVDKTKGNPFGIDEDEQRELEELMNHSD